MKLFTRLAHDGNVLMPLATYPFSQKFGWVADKWRKTLLLYPFTLPCYSLLVVICLKHDKYTHMALSLSHRARNHHRLRIGVSHGKYYDECGDESRDNDR